MKTLFATHFHELAELSAHLDAAKCFFVSVEVQDGRIFFVRTVKEGKGSSSYGIQVAELAGLPREVVEHAKAVRLQMSDRRVDASTAESVRYEIGDSVRCVMIGSVDGRAEAIQAGMMTALRSLLNELKSLDLDEISPREALEKLYVRRMIER